MQLKSLSELEQIRSGEKTSEDRYIRDRFMYQQGRAGSNEVLSQSLSERDMDMYLMGNSMCQWERDRA